MKRKSFWNYLTKINCLGFKKQVMKDLNLSISNKGIDLLKENIGKEFISMRHDKFFKNFNSVSYVIEIETSIGRFAIFNDIEWFDNFCAGPNDLPFLDFKKLKQNEDPLNYQSEAETSITFINETILNILLIQDKADVFENNKYIHQMNSTEGIIIVTNKKQYGFYKENMWLDSEMLIWEGNNVVDKMEKLKDHFAIFGQPYNTKCKRYVISLKDGIEKEIEQANVVGEIPDEEEL